MATEVKPTVYQHRLAHSKVVHLEGANLLVDTGPETEWEGLKGFIESQGGVDRLFLSHDHGDHVGNAEKVIDAYDPEVLVPENEPFDSVDLGSTNVTEISDREEIVAGVEAIEIPGHTRGICALYLPRRETVLGTDVLDGADRRGLPPGYLLAPPAEYNWDSEAAERNLEKLLELSFDTVVVTHGTNVDRAARRKLDEYLNFPEYYRKDLLEEVSR